jgi:hypothetical protein
MMPPAMSISVSISVIYWPRLIGVGRAVIARFVIAVIGDATDDGTGGDAAYDPGRETASAGFSLLRYGHGRDCDCRRNR